MIDDCKDQVQKCAGEGDISWAQHSSLSKQFHNHHKNVMHLRELNDIIWLKAKKKQAKFISGFEGREDYIFIIITVKIGIYLKSYL